MLDQLMQLVKEFGENEVVKNPEIPNEYNNAVMSEAAYAIGGTMQDALASGNVQGLMNMFTNDDDQAVMSNPLSQQMQGSFIDGITSKLGINKQTAMRIGAMLIPLVVSHMVKRTRSSAPQDSGFNITDLIGSLTGGQGGGNGISNLISQFTGGGSGGNGFGLDDVIRQLSGGARAQQQNGGLSNLITSFFGR